MATRSNTVEYVGTMRNTTLAAGATEEQAVTVVIAETGSRAFTSVFMEVYADENNASTTSRGSITARMLGVGIDAVADSDVTVTDTITDTGDQGSFVFKRDLTSYFTTNYTGTSHAVGLRFSFTQTGTNALTVINVAMRLVVSYTYDDASETTRTKTVRIPLQSYLTALATTETEIKSNGTSAGGSSQIPDLSTFLPEATKSYKDIFFDIEWNDNISATTNQTVSLRTGTDTTYTGGVLEKANNAGLHHHWFWKRTDLATNAATSFKMWATTAAHHHPAVMLVVTYTYDHSNAADQIASVLIPMTAAWGNASPAATAAVAVRYFAEVWVEEPATITLLHSGVVFNLCYTSSVVSPTIWAGSAGTTAYTSGYGSVSAGSHHLIHRVDSGGLTGLTLARGANVIEFNVYGNAAFIFTTAYLVLNYTHGKPTNGSGEANHTIKRLAIGDAADSANLTIASQAEAIPEAAYWLNGYGARIEYCYSTVGGLLSLEMIRAGGDAPSGGRFSAAGCCRNGEAAEQGSVAVNLALADWFMRFAADPELGRLNPETARTWYVCSTTANNYQVETWLTYHTVTFTKTHAITGSAAGTVTLAVHYNGAASYMLGPSEKVATASRSGNGNVDTTWYDNTSNMIVEAVEDSTHVGRSYTYTY